MPDDFLSPDDFGLLTRAFHAKTASEEHYNYVVQRLWQKYKLAENDEIAPNGEITRQAAEVN